MRLRQPAQLDTRAILTAALDAKGDSEWHRNPGPDGVWRWHASSLSACPRQQILKRAAAERDEFVVETDPLESRLVFELGHQAHTLLQDGIKLSPQYRLIGVEMGGHHPDMPLAALADIVYQHEDEVLICEVKTESHFAATHRREEVWLAEDMETMTAARPEHCLQMAAQALVLEATDLLLDEPPLEIERGWVVYQDKETGEHDQQPVVIGDELRRHVIDRVELLEEFWRRYVADGWLPALLPDELKVDKRHKPPREYFATAWQCRPRSDTDPRGLYCRVREECMTRAGKLQRPKLEVVS